MAEFRENKDVRRPFLSTPDDRVYFPASVIEKARRAAARCLKRGEGIALIIGESGVGKTLLARVLAAGCDEDDLVVSVSASRKFSVKAFLQQFLFGLHQTFVGADESELRLMALDYLERAPQKRRILLVDDAQHLTLRVFDEIRMLIDHSEQPTQFSAALFGTPTLEDRLNLPQLYPFAQRIVTRSWLDVFTTDETDRFIMRELKRSGVNAKFTKSARKTVADLAEGSPRIVVQLCDRALFFATENLSEPPEGKKSKPVEINDSDVQTAWRDLQSIFEEATLASAPAATDDVVEFGELDDDDDEAFGGDETVVAQTSDATDDAANDPENKPESLVAQSDQGPLDYVHDGAEMPTISAGGDDSMTESASAGVDAASADERRRAAKEFWDRKDESIDQTQSGARLAVFDEGDESAIDPAIEERLLAKLDASERSANATATTSAEPTRRNDPMNFELVTEDGHYSTTSVGRDGDATFIGPDGAESRTHKTRDLWGKGGSFDEALSLDSAYPPTYESRKSTTRRPLGDPDDDSASFRNANGSNAGDSALYSAVGEVDSMSDSTKKSILEAWDPESQLLEDRAYRQIIAASRHIPCDLATSDRCLQELRQIEQELAEEARRVCNIHLQLRAVCDQHSSDAIASDGSGNFPDPFASN
ncbi:MAG: ExeA family protein [Thermoguttaceae bacterium]|jgi:type II secretory pathway predicted ATPase ExeA